MHSVPKRPLIAILLAAAMALSLFAFAQAGARGAQKTAEQWRAYFETNEELCSDALNSGKTGWNTSPDHAAYVAEAAQRGLTIDGCLHKSWETPQHSTEATDIQHGDDVLQKAFNYVFTGNINGDSKVAQVQIINRKECIVRESVSTAKNGSLVPVPVMTFFFRRMKPDTGQLLSYSSLPNVIALSTISFQIEGDAPVVEFENGTKSNRATIPIYGDPERTKKALQVIFSQYCAPKGNGLPF